jgi:redox-sensitive bicupin YhaK (pirin superfamily)
MTQRSITTILEAPTSRHGAGLVTRDASSAVLGADLDPFIMVSLYDMAGPTFPPHPHAGFAVATYMLPESATGFLNQDSLGHLNAIPPGALHVTVAGSGVQHEEQPQTPGVLARGYQIWIDLENGARQVAPHALHLGADDVPIVTGDGFKARVVLGSSHGVRSPVSLPTDVRLIDVTLAPGARFTQDLAPDETAFVFMIAGAAGQDGQTAHGGELARTDTGEGDLTLEAGLDGARFTLFAGRPYRQPRAQRGPFVASDSRELAGFMAAFAEGRFGPLTPFADQARAA